jgi:hypothetical protein
VQACCKRECRSRSVLTPSTIRFRYVILVAIFMFGVYNFWRGVLADWDKGHWDWADRAYRVRRFPLRPWSEKQWQKHKNRQQFRMRRPGDGPRYWSEEWQLWIGDDCWPHVKRSRKAVHQGRQGVKIAKRYRKTKEQMEEEKGNMAKGWDW